jgi:hypothetical protein
MGHDNKMEGFPKIPAGNAKSKFTLHKLDQPQKVASSPILDFLIYERKAFKSFNRKALYEICTSR